MIIKDTSLADVHEELQYIIDIITAFVEKHGSSENRDKLKYLKQSVKEIRDADAMDEVDLLLQSLSI